MNPIMILDYWNIIYLTVPVLRVYLENPLYNIIPINSVIP